MYIALVATWSMPAPGCRSHAYPVMEMNYAAPEAALGQKLELDANVIRQRALSATDDDRDEKQVALIDQPCGDRLASESGTTDRDVAG